MFSSKKNKLLPRPSLLSCEQIVVDLNNANISDIAFSIMPNDNTQSTDLHFPTNVNDAENIYGKARRYLDGIQKLKILSDILNLEEKNLQIDYEEIEKLAKEIRNQAQAVLKII
ncbi:hypothetical protein PV327_005064 [Microctonus hyperodae]|uniref:Uncharacterized protein n=1 Tax=Microctonus hyperodae TaxID=165561 RepID=A0AA39G206_MICHY|nr:hypothetical protein PV327_005064 [Microctonus hyperodae]